MLRGSKSGAGSGSGGRTGSGSGSRGRQLPGIDGAVPAFNFSVPEHLMSKQGKFEPSREKRVLVAVNAARVTHADSTNNVVHQYHMDFMPPIDSKKLRMTLWEEHFSAFGFHHLYETVFNGQIMYSARMPEALKRGASVEAQVQHPITGAPVTMLMRQTSSLKASDPQMITVLNTVTRYCMSTLNYQQFNRNYFDPSRKQAVPSLKLEVWPGVVSAIRAYDAGLLMSVDPIHKMLRKETAYDTLLAAFSAQPQDERKIDKGVPVFGERARRSVAADLIGKTIMLQYSNKMHRVDEIDYDKTPLFSFLRSDGSSISILDYLTTNYPETVKRETVDPTQPLIVSRAKKLGPKRRDTEAEDTSVAYLVPQFCQLTGLTDEMRARRHHMQELVDYQRLSPERRVAGAEAHLRRLNEHAETALMLDSWGLKIEEKLLETEARQFNSERLFGANGRSFTYKKEVAEWTREVKTVKVLNGKALRKGEWVFIIGDSQRSTLGSLCQKAWGVMAQVGNRIGMSVGEPIVRFSESSHVAKVIDATRSAGAELNAAGIQPQMVLVALNDDSKQRYDALKQLVCTTPELQGAVSQMVLMSTLKKEKVLESIILKLLMQMNCKLGGSLWGIENPFARTQQQHVMVIGYDNYLDSSERGKACGALVASANPQLTEMLSFSALHTTPASERNALYSFMENSLKGYHQRNGHVPSRIYFYRDGVGEGQIATVFQTEVTGVKQAIKDVCKTLGWSAEVKLTFLVVNKSVNHRIYHKAMEKAGAVYKNPLPGTVVDNAITRQERYDFYLVPQSVNQGTVTPVSYTVVHDENTNIAAGQLQWFTYKLTHLYYNWQGTIRVPAPVMYAHKLAFLVAQSLHDCQPAGELRDRMWFL